ncbi:PadR family transcriptional regulator [Vibrio agarivorans]|uniref:PadR family transcriptional regulator n=1 Tax=Vibrio agarivorans TaxID=153622 RepID=A0ABT7Y711_9VIBR|nr:PadR family transcriptional regulator [Vibrio agarivorans]MDN2483819.1 PadR family transcriptional regulator [Vibrio agarivorans]
MKKHNQLATTILYLVNRKPMTGYDLTQSREIAITRSSSHQQIYRECRNLVEDGLIDFEVVYQESKPDKKVYNVTELGQQLLSVLQTEVRPDKPATLRINDAPFALIGNTEYIKARIESLHNEVNDLVEMLNETISPMLSLSIQLLIDTRKSELKYNEGVLREILTNEAFAAA